MGRSVAVAPEDCEREGEGNRHVAEQKAADGRHPQERRGVAADVPDLEDPQGQAEEGDQDERGEQRDGGDG